MEPIILASSSPRRQETLKLLGIPFQVIMPNIDELSAKATVDTEDISELLAREKVTAVLKTLPPEQKIPWILGCDTIIVKAGKIYGKPNNQEEAFSFLHDFQGSTHTVITTLVLYNGKTRENTAKTCKTRVTFSPMTDEEIQWYVDTGEWHGSAGGYRIQSLASVFISKIEGSQSCVVGLPINELYMLLKENGYSILD